MALLAGPEGRKGEREKRQRKREKREEEEKERKKRQRKKKRKKKEKEELGLHKAVFQDLECIMSKKDEAANQSFSQVIL